MTLRNFFAVLITCLGLFIVYLGLRHVWAGRQAQNRAQQEWQAAAKKIEREQKTSPAPQPAKPRTTRLLPGESVGHLVIPRFKASLYVVEGAEKEDLENGPGHVVGTALPGTTGNCVIAGHRDTVFRGLKDIRKGDEILVETHEATYHYRVNDMSIILPTNTKCLMPTPKPELHLITCYPFYYVGNAPKRFVVSASLEQVQTASAEPGRPPA